MLLLSAKDLNFDALNDIVGNFPCTGMHGGTMLLRSDCKNIRFPKNVHAVPATKEQLSLYSDYISEFCDLFGFDIQQVLDHPFTIISPDSNNPYKQMYVMN